MPRATSATLYAYEASVVSVFRNGGGARLYAYENQVIKVGAHLVSAVLSAYENTVVKVGGAARPVVAVLYATENSVTKVVRPNGGVAVLYATENSIVPANPYRMMTYDSTLGVYVPAPWYIWNGTVWQQAV